MYSYLIRRLLLVIPVLLGVSLMVFAIAKVTPGDPARMMAGPTAKIETIEKLHRQLGLDDPIIIQYGRFLWKAVQGDFGVSYRGQNDVLKSIIRRFPFTVELSLATLAIAVPIGIPLGLLAALKRGSILDRLIIFLD